MNRPIRSYVLRQGRTTPAQKRALDELLMNGVTAVRKGYDVVITPRPPLYFDFRQSAVDRVEISDDQVHLVGQRPLDVHPRVQRGEHAQPGHDEPGQ